MPLKPLHAYFVATGSWFLAFGLQSVLFAYLVTLVLNESAERVGFAQMAYLIPGTLLILLGGSVADHFGGRRIAIICLLYTSPSPRDRQKSRMPSSA